MRCSLIFSYDYGSERGLDIKPDCHLLKLNDGYMGVTTHTFYVCAPVFLLQFQRDRQEAGGWGVKGQPVCREMLLWLNSRHKQQKRGEVSVDGCFQGDLVHTREGLARAAQLMSSWWWECVVDSLRHSEATEWMAARDGYNLLKPRPLQWSSQTFLKGSTVFKMMLQTRSTLQNMTFAGEYSRFKPHQYFSLFSFVVLELESPSLPWFGIAGMALSHLTRVGNFFVGKFSKYRN